jgi:hypothetical protein
MRSMGVRVEPPVRTIDLKRYLATEGCANDESLVKCIPLFFKPVCPRRWELARGVFWVEEAGSER